MGDQLIDWLIANDVKYVFVGPGTNHQYGFIDALYRRREEIDTVLVRHEAMAPMMAEGWYRATGEPGVFHVGGGPGLANAVLGVMSAYTCGSSIIGITGEVHRDFWGRGGMQELQTKTWAQGHRVLEPMVKRYWQISNPRKLPEVENQAYSALKTGRPGPVLLDIPMDLWDAPVEVAAETTGNHLPTGRPFPDPSAVERAVSLLMSARRPVILAGGGVVSAAATADLVRLAEALSAPVVTSNNGKSAISADHPLASGSVSAVASSRGFETVREADLILALGTRFHEWTTSGWKRDLPFAFPPTQLIQVDIVAEELGRYYPIEIGIEADLRHTLGALVTAVRGQPGEPSSEDRRAKLAERRRSEHGRLAELAAIDSVPIVTVRVLKALREALGHDAILLPDAGDNGSFFDNLWECFEPGTYIRDNGMHAMGFACAAALGVKLAKPERDVVVVTGDGCMTQANWVLGTAAEYGISARFVVLNNGGLGGGLAAQTGVFGGRELATRFEHHAKDERYSQDFALLAKSYGVQGVRVEQPDEIAPAIEQMLAAEGPALVDIVTDINVHPESAGRMWLTAASDAT